jgi:hypothetical protein
MKKMNEKGAALPTVLITFAVLMVFSTTLINTNTSEGLASIDHKQDTESYYVARSAVEIVSEALTSDETKYDAFKSEISSLADNTPTDTGVITIGSNTAVVTIVKSGSVIKLTGEAEVSGNIAYSSITLEPTSSELTSVFEHAIYTNSEIPSSEIQNINVLNGPIGSENNIEYYDESGNMTNKTPTIKYDGCDIDFGVHNTAFYCNGTYYNAEDLETSIGYIDRNASTHYDPVDSSAFPTVPTEASLNLGNRDVRVITSDGYYPSINSNKGLIQFDTTAGDLNIVSGDFILSQSEIRISGDNIVNLYVDGTFNMGSHSFISIINNNPDQFRIVVTGGNSVTLRGNATIDAIVYAAGCDVSLQGGGSNTVLSGAIISESVSISGNVDINYVSPSNDNPITGLVDKGFDVLRYED